jgi:hypothetical protein
MIKQTNRADDHWTDHLNADPRICRLVMEIELARKHACLSVRCFGARGAADWVEYESKLKQLEQLEAKLKLEKGDD